MYCEAEAIPSTAADAFEGTPISEATLHVPDELVEFYKHLVPWNGFGNIVGLSGTSINSVWKDKNGSMEIYTPNGKKLDKPQKGLNIIRTKDGKVNKVVIK